jgi:hypothetical protein
MFVSLNWTTCTCHLVQLQAACPIALLVSVSNCLSILLCFLYCLTRYYMRQISYNCFITIYIDVKLPLFYYSRRLSASQLLDVTVRLKWHKNGKSVFCNLFCLHSNLHENNGFFLKSTPTKISILYILTLSIVSAPSVLWKEWNVQFSPHSSWI